MQRKTVITLVEAIVIIIVLLFLILAIVMPLQGRAGLVARQRIRCGTNLKYLGAAMYAYANDYKDQFPQLPGTGPWSKKLGFGYDLPKPDFKNGGAQSQVERTITASWYLLVKYADVLPMYFGCPADNAVTSFDGRNLKQLDLVELWDFGTEPHKHVSYAMHNPFGAYPAGKSRPASFAIAGDMSPWMRLGDFVKPDASNKDWRKNITLMPPYFSRDVLVERDQIQQSNAIAHGREGQNVLFADGHSEYCRTPDVGMKHDNIYTYWSGVMNRMGSENKAEPILQQKPSENDIRIGTNPTARDKDNDAKSADDSFLAI